MARKTIVYIDGFNLYYGCLKGTPHKWLDLQAFCSLLLAPQYHDIIEIKYFTAPVSARPDDPKQPQRQQLYLRALGTTPIVQTFMGHFLVQRVRLPLVSPPASGPRTVEVLKAEEKGSDVNLATHLLCDAYEQRFEAAVVVSNDSDLVEPISVVRHRLGLVVGVLNPHPEKPAVQLAATATFMKPIRKGAAKHAQFPRFLTDSNGRFERPGDWY